MWRQLAKAHELVSFAKHAPQMAKWRVLGPEPRMPDAPLPTALTPRAQALSAQLDMMTSR